MAKALFKNINMFTPTTSPIIRNVEEIFQSITLLLNTRTGQFPFRPDFGIDFEDDLFDFVDTLGAVDIFRRVTEKIVRFEPRVRLDLRQTSVTPLPDENAYDLKLFFTIPDLTDETFEFSGQLGNGAIAA